ncbi:DUF2079 domain-containing protein [Synechococcus sp. UW179A]|uniref:DUF2079 domain-containing protein n=1 Tax=Synechococcus sp. UW179A TaxID=2575510 RepID=UPI000E0E131C|nr:DUF2079 domain-containing protein [Synechococcus sp. UW179A]
MRDPFATGVSARWSCPRPVILLAGGFFLLCLTIQIWRLESLSATYDQALFLQELWSTAQGRPFESSLSSVLSGPVKVGGELPRIGYLHLGQHANALTLFVAPLLVFLGSWALPIAQVSVLTAAGLVLWRIASRRLPESLALRITAAYYLSGAVIGPALENFHDLIWLPLLGFLVVEALLEDRRGQLILTALLLLLVREDSGLVLFSLGLWGLVRRPGMRWMSVGLMLMAFFWVLLVTGWIQPAVDSSLSDRFLQEKFGHLVEDVSGGTFAVMLGMLRQPLALLQAIVSPPGSTLGFLLALSLPLLFIPLLSVDSLLLVAVPLFIALVSQGRSALSVTLRYVLALVPGLYLGAVLWWQTHPAIWSRRWIRRCWTGALALGLLLTLVGNPHRSLSALVPDSFSPWVHVPPTEMLDRRAAALEAVAMIPEQASVSADTPLLPLLAQRDVVIRFPKHIRYRDRDGDPQNVDWVVAFPGFYSPLAPVFDLEHNQQRSIRRELNKLTESGDYQLVHCHQGAVVLQRQQNLAGSVSNRAGSARDCPWIQ